MTDAHAFPCGKVPNSFKPAGEIGAMKIVTTFEAGSAGTGAGRRTVLAALGVGAAQAALAPGVTAQAPLHAVAFRRLCAALTGFPEGDMPRFVDEIRQALSAPGPQRAGLDAMLNLARDAPTADAVWQGLRGTPLEPLARALTAALYTGTFQRGDQARVVSYEDALVWPAADYVSAPSLCGGEFGHWSDPPPVR